MSSRAGVEKENGTRKQRTRPRPPRSIPAPVQLCPTAPPVGIGTPRCLNSSRRVCPWLRPWMPRSQRDGALHQKTLRCRHPAWRGWRVAISWCGGGRDFSGICLVAVLASGLCQIIGASTPEAFAENRKTESASNVLVSAPRKPCDCPNSERGVEPPGTNRLGKYLVGAGQSRPTQETWTVCKFSSAESLPR